MCTVPAHGGPRCPGSGQALKCTTAGHPSTGFDTTAGPTSFVGRSADCTVQFESRPHGSDSRVQ